jgi:hypothetical protein
MLDSADRARLFVADIMTDIYEVLLAEVEQREGRSWQSPRGCAAGARMRSRDAALVDRYPCRCGDSRGLVV